LVDIIAAIRRSWTIWRNVLPEGTILDVSYEDVVADLEGQARRILTHCGLDWDPRCLDFHRQRRSVRTASFAQVRRPIYDSWWDDGAIMSHISGPFLPRSAQTFSRATLARPSEAQPDEADDVSSVSA